MRRQVLAVAALAAALGTACVNRRQAAGIYVQEPMVETGVFTEVDPAGRLWVFDPMAPWEKEVEVWVPPETYVLANGTQVDLRAVKPGRKVRLVYDIRRDGTAVAERIDIMGPVKGELHPDTDM